MQAIASIFEHLRHRAADARSPFAPHINLLVSHIQPTLFINFCQQRPELHIAALISGPDDISLLTIMKDCLRVGLAVLGIADGPEESIMIVKVHGCCFQSFCDGTRRARLNFEEEFSHVITAVSSTTSSSLKKPRKRAN